MRLEEEFAQWEGNTNNSRVEFGLLVKSNVRERNIELEMTEECVTKHNIGL
jgi:hypothetical protein